MRAAQCNQIAAAGRKMRRMDEILFGGEEDQEPDFIGALGTKPCRTEKQAKEEFYLLQPTAITSDGARIWSF